MSPDTMMRNLPGNVATLAVVFLSSASPCAQQQATTLAELTRRADAIAQMRVLTSEVTSDGSRRVVLRGQRSVVGASPPPRALVLTEPAGGRSCGRALHGLVPGMSLVVFLAGRDHAARPVHSGSRALVPLAPGLIDHLRALHDAGPTGQLAVLARALADPLPRIRADAALALPLLENLERADAATRSRVATALQRALATEPNAAPHLLTAARRLRLAGIADALIDAYLTGAAPGLARPLRDTIVAIDPERAAARIAGDTHRDPGRSRRARALAVALDGRRNTVDRPVFRSVLRGGSR